MVLIKQNNTSDNVRARSKQNCQVNCDFLKASKHRRKTFIDTLFK